MPAAVPIAAAVIAAGATVYSVQQSKATAEDQMRAQRDLEAKKANVPKLPESAILATSITKGQQQAASAGGTIMSDPKANASPQIGSPIMTGQKTLLGA